MLPNSERSRLLAGLMAGRYTLLLGAGFSSAATSADSKPLPLTNELVDELARKFGKSKGHPLHRLWGSLGKPDRENYLVERFKGCIVPDSLRVLSRFFWERIYTFNVDDVVESIYDKKNLRQYLDILNYSDPFKDPSSPVAVQLVHLHGSVLRPNAGFVFSTQELGRAAVSSLSWMEILADEFVSSPFIVVGCSLDEFDLEASLSSRQGATPSIEPIPSVFVAREIDDVLRSTCDRFGLIPIEATAEHFFSWLLNLLPEPPIPKKFKLNPSEIYRILPSEFSNRIFSRQFLLVKEKELPEPLVDHDFREGWEPTWRDIRDRRDIGRQDVVVLSQHIQSGVIDNVENIIVIEEAAEKVLFPAPRERVRV